MKKENGFTLVELLAVIVILAIILLIAVPNILGVIDNAKEDSDKSSAKMIWQQGRYHALQAESVPTAYEISCDTMGMGSDVNKPNFGAAGWDETSSDLCGVEITNGSVTGVTYGTLMDNVSSLSAIDALDLQN